MKTRIREVIKDEGGAALALTIVLLLIGGLVIAPVLGHMGTGIRAGEVHDDKMGQLYAADAGVEDAMWRMVTQLDVPSLSKCEENGWAYQVDPFELNGKTVQVDMQFVTRAEDNNKGIFKITSRVFPLDVDFAQDPEPLTTIVSYVEARESTPLDFSDLLKYAVASGGTVNIEGGGPATSQIHGDVHLPDKSHLSGADKVNGEIYDEVNDDVVVAWPTADQLKAYYWDDVKHLELQAYPDGTVIDVSGTTEDEPYVMEASYAEGSLTIQGDGYIEFAGTIYVKGNLSVSANLILNDQTLFSEGEIDVRPHTSMYGSGCVIAVLKVYLLPGVHTKPDDYVLVLSIENEAKLLPTVPPGQGDGFYGTVAGKTNAQTQPWVVATWVDREQNLRFPTGSDQGEASWKSFGVTSYNINP